MSASSKAGGGAADNVEVNHYRRILAKEWNRGNPLSANIELTFRCNLKCDFCYNVDDPVSHEMTTPQILESLRNAAENHTTLVIAHRLSTIIDADQIMVMKDGRIVERGNHQQLLGHKGLYANLWELQQQEEQNQVSV